MLVLLVSIGLAVRYAPRRRQRKEFDDQFARRAGFQFALLVPSGRSGGMLGLIKILETIVFQ